MLAMALGSARGEIEDPGKRVVGNVDVRVYHATNGNPVELKGAGKADAQTVKRFQAEKSLKFQNYRLLGADSQPLLQSYENWAQPLKPSNEILVRFEAQGHPTETTAVLDLELWISRKKTVKTDARLAGKKPLFVLGPDWRGGKLIISVALVGQQKKAPMKSR